MAKICTIGFTGKKGRAEEFFDLLNKAGVKMLIDVRLHNTSQLDGYSHMLDLSYMCKLNEIKYKHDPNLAPTELTLKKWQAHESKKNTYVDKFGNSYPSIDWDEYEIEFDDTMCERNISDYIESEYSQYYEKYVICIQCTEPTPEHCHRRLVANYFKRVFEEKYGEKIEIENL